MLEHVCRCVDERERPHCRRVRSVAGPQNEYYTYYYLKGPKCTLERLFSFT